MRNRTSGQAAFLTAQLSNKRNCQTIKRPDDDHDALQQQQQAGGSMTYLLQPKPKKKKQKKIVLGEDHCNDKKTDDKRTTTAAPRLHSQLFFDFPARWLALQLDLFPTETSPHWKKQRQQLAHTYKLSRTTTTTTATTISAAAAAAGARDAFSLQWRRY